MCICVYTCIHTGLWLKNMARAVYIGTNEQQYPRGERASRQRDAKAGRGRGKICTSGETPEASGSHAYF